MESSVRIARSHDDGAHSCLRPGVIPTATHPSARSGSAGDGPDRTRGTHRPACDRPSPTGHPTATTTAPHTAPSASPHSSGHRRSIPEPTGDHPHIMRSARPSRHITRAQKSDRAAPDRSCETPDWARPAPPRAAPNGRVGAPPERCRTRPNDAGSREVPAGMPPDARDSGAYILFSTKTVGRSDALKCASETRWERRHLVWSAIPTERRSPEPGALAGVSA